MKIIGKMNGSRVALVVLAMGVMFLLVWVSELTKTVNILTGMHRAPDDYAVRTVNPEPKLELL